MLHNLPRLGNSRYQTVKKVASEILSENLHPFGRLWYEIAKLGLFHSLPWESERLFSIGALSPCSFGRTPATVTRNDENHGRNSFWQRRFARHIHPIRVQTSRCLSWVTQISYGSEKPLGEGQRESESAIFVHDPREMSSGVDINVETAGINPFARWTKTGVAHVVNR